MGKITISFENLIFEYTSCIGVRTKLETAQTFRTASLLFYPLKVTDFAQQGQIDNDTLKKLKAIQELDSDTKAHIFATIDAFLKASKLKNIAAL